MKNNNYREKLIDALLREELGGERPPDMTQAILAKAAPRRLSHWWWAAAAAMVLLTVGLPILFGGRYPAPAFTDNTPGAIDRAEWISSGDRKTEFALGGYCTVSMQPHTLLRIEGQRYKEQIYLANGQVMCSVDRHIGKFSVRTETGTASVLGTRFSVRVLEEQGDSKMLGKRMFVKVFVGTVLLSSALGNVQLAAGEEAATPEGGSAAGIMVERGREVVVVRVDGQEANTRFIYGDALNDDVKKLIGGNRVNLTWSRDGERLRLTNIEMVVPEEQSGTVTGKITAKGHAWIDVEPEGGVVERYFPRWMGGAPKDGGGLDKDMLQAIAERKVGDKVEVKWTYAERKRAVELKLVEAAPAPEPVAESGVVTGVVTEKGETWLRVKPAEGESKRYVPRWTGGLPSNGGGYDKQMLEAIGRVHAGDTVKLEWVFSEHLRVVNLQVLEKAAEE